ncbi:type II secretion system F family protein [Zavarzinia sp. CC-PAN008]|uniref:type II secretion system F family protein n=1 Tax=Zavarzinia sp. CC-PAN008 TaxID=3243332 RepID=UPI003F748647
MNTFVLAIIVLMAVGGVAAVLLATRKSNPMSRRLGQLEADRSRLYSDLVNRGGGESALERRQRLTSLAQIVKRLRLVTGTKSQEIQERLSQGGFRSRDALVIFVISKLVLLVLFTALGILVFWVANTFGWQSPFWKGAGTLAFMALGFFGPNIYVKNEADKRKKLLEKGMPDALDLLVICAESGMSLDTSLDRVAKELVMSWPLLAEELAVTRIELTFLPDRREALRNFAKRVNVPAARGVVTTLLQSEKFGTSLAQSLRVLSHEFRKERLLRAEEKAARLPATMTVPLIIFILPTLMVVLIGPASIIVRHAMK